MREVFIQYHLPLKVMGKERKRQKALTNAWAKPPEVSYVAHAAATVHFKFSLLIGRGLILPP